MDVDVDDADGDCDDVSLVERVVDGVALLDWMDLDSLDGRSEPLAEEGLSLTVDEFWSGK